MGGSDRGTCVIVPRPVSLESFSPISGSWIRDRHSAEPLIRYQSSFFPSPRSLLLSLASTTSPASHNPRSQAATSSSQGRPSSKPLLPRRPSHPYVKPWTRRGWKSSRPVSGISNPFTARRSDRNGTSGWVGKGAMHGLKGPEVLGRI
jgi:hypothetical protein